MTLNKHGCLFLQILLLAVFVSTISGADMVPVTPIYDTACNISSNDQEKSVTCEMDPGEIEGFDLHIYNLRPESGCEMKMNSNPIRNITVNSKSLILFKGCKPGDLQVTAQKLKECSDLKNCLDPFHLNVPTLPSGFPADLNKATWTLRPPQHGTVELMSPSGCLKQDLPDQPCDESFSIEMAEEKDGHPIGRFCPEGSIRKVLIHTGVTVTWSPKLQIGGIKSLLVAAFKNEIKESYIFHVFPPMGDTPALIASPGWPVGIKNDSTISWIVTFPPKKEAILKFFNLSKPTCSQQHTSIMVQRIGILEEDYSRREDEMSEDKIIVSENFFLNMSNCRTEKGNFSIIAGITLQKKMNLILTIILSVVAVLVVVSTTVLVVVCIMIRKKKQLSHEVSIYNSGGTNNELDRESQIYACIDDTLVYTHLMKKDGLKEIHEEDDVIQSFRGHDENPVVSQNVDNDNKESYRLSQQGPPLPNRPLSHNLSLMSSDT